MGFWSVSSLFQCPLLSEDDISVTFDNDPIFSKVVYNVSYGPHRDKICLRGFVNNTGANQPAHPRRLISPFVIHCLESSIYKLASR